METKGPTAAFNESITALDRQISDTRLQLKSEHFDSSKYSFIADQLSDLLEQRKREVYAVERDAIPSWAARTGQTGQQESDATWRFVQSFGDDNSSEDDLVTAVEFDHKGQLLAVGDKAGRICIFVRITSTEQEGDPDQRPTRRRSLEYSYFTEFQSHEPEFDVLKNLEIEEKINMVEWPKQRSNSVFLLATNDKTVKLWKIHPKKVPQQIERSEEDLNIRLDTTAVEEDVTTHTEKHVFGNAHQYHINSISINSDGETFISADDLRINLWSMHNSEESFNIVDVKPVNLEELTEVITSVTFHPIHCNLFMYSSSRGSIQLLDMRDAALCDQHAKQFRVEDDANSETFYTEIISSISDAKFTSDGRYIVSRDYLNVKVWDVNMEREPVATIPVHNYLKDQLSDLYESDCIFDKFECAVSNDGSQIVTGSYNNNFVIHDLVQDSSITIEAERDGPRRNGGRRRDLDFRNINPQKKVMHLDWHPTQNAVAVAGMNKLYIYQAVVPKNR